MTHKLTTEHWKTLLPEAFHWLSSKLELTSQTSATDADLHVVAAQTDKKDSATFQVHDNLAGVALTTEATNTGWDGKSQPLNLCVDQKQFLVLPMVLGQSKDLQLARQWGLNAAKQLATFRYNSVSFYIPESYDALSVFEGFAAGLYDTSKFRMKQKNGGDPSFPSKVQLVAKTKVQEGLVEKAVALAKATTFTRFLQDAPANWLDTEQFATIAKEAFGELGVNCRIMGEEELAKENMNLFLSVARGSTLPAQMIVVEVDGQDSSSTCALVGKGLTFDAGGISLKPSASMGEMKYDMSGGAAVFGAMYFLSHIKPPYKTVGLIGCAENMPSAHATKPGDVITARNGKTVDVQNTDAEGRLVLADVLNYAATVYKPDMIIDAATLTGACLHALGHNGGAILSNEDQFAEYVKTVADDNGEPFWQLPLWPDMEKDIKGDYSDLSNIAKPGVLAGTIIGGIFLREFVEKTRWAHLDIAGVAWSCKAAGYPNMGGSGYAVRTLAECCLRYEKK